MKNQTIPNTSCGGQWQVLLCAPPEEGQVRQTDTPDYVLDDFLSYPPLGLLCLAGALPDTVRVTVLDAAAAKLDIAGTVRVITDARPAVLGLTVATHLLYAAAGIAAAVKQYCPDTVIVVGGPHVRLYPEETIRLPGIDFAVAGYAETGFARLVAELAAGRQPIDSVPPIPGLICRSAGGTLHWHAPQELPACIDGLPLPRRELLAGADYHSLADEVATATLCSSRGCPHRCRFCDCGDRTYHYRSGAAIVDEIGHLFATGTRHVHFIDDTFNLLPERVEEICRELIRRHLPVTWSARARVDRLPAQLLRLMQQSGCQRLHLGVESLDPEILAYSRKQITYDELRRVFRDCRRTGIETLAYVIMGWPGQSPQDCWEAYREIRRLLRPDYLLISLLYPLPGSELYRDLLTDGKLPRDCWAEFAAQPVADFCLPEWRQRWTTAAYQAVIDRMYRDFYLSLPVVMREVWRLRTWQQCRRKLQAGIRLLRTVAAGRGGANH
ncbi:MAG TPA: radical SAM protein [bacterium]|nr:radical SAM protein [bacterium]